MYKCSQGRPLVSRFLSGPVWLWQFHICDLSEDLCLEECEICLNCLVWDLSASLVPVSLITSTHCCQVKPRQVGFVQSWLCWPFSLLTPFFWGISGMGGSHRAQRSRQLKMVNHTVKTVGLLYEPITLWWLLIWGHMLLWYKWATTVWGDARIMTLAAAYKQLQYIIPHHLCSVAAAQKK